MKPSIPFVLAITLSASVVLAHGGVKNPAVMARMDGMSAIADGMKALGAMAKGAVAFDAGAADAAVATIADHAARIPALFEAEESDPKSEAKPEIWADFGDFTDKAGALTDVANGLSGAIRSQGDLGPAMKQLGAACKSCHADYRIKK